MRYSPVASWPVAARSQGRVCSPCSAPRVGVTRTTASRPFINVTPMPPLPSLGPRLSEVTKKGWSTGLKTVVRTGVVAERRSTVPSGVTRVDPEFGIGSDGAGRSRTGAIVEPSGHQLIGALGDARLELPQVVGEPDADGLGRVGRIQVEDDRMRSRLAVEVHRFEGRGMHRVARLAMGDAGAGHADGGDPGIHRAGRLRRERGPERATARRGDHPAAVGSRARGVSTPGTAVGADAEA